MLWKSSVARLGANRKLLRHGSLPAGAGWFGCGKYLPQRAGHGVDAIFGNPVAREGVSHPLPVFEASGVRIVNRDEPSRRVAQVAEIAAQLRRVGHREGDGVRRQFLVSLVVEHEERPVAPVVHAGDPYRSVDLETVLIQLVVGLLAVVQLEEVLVRVERLAARELVDAAVHAVGARLERHVDDAARRAPVLRVVAVGDDLEFLHRVDRRHVGDVVAPLNRVVRRAVEQELVVAVLAAVDRPVGDGAVVERPLINRRPVVGDARRQVRQHEGIARVQRKLGDAQVVDDHAAVGVRRLEQRRFAGDRHRLRCASPTCSVMLSVCVWPTCSATPSCVCRRNPSSSAEMSSCRA